MIKIYEEFNLFKAIGHIAKFACEIKTNNFSMQLKRLLLQRNLTFQNTRNSGDIMRNLTENEVAKISGGFITTGVNPYGVHIILDHPSDYYIYNNCVFTWDGCFLGGYYLARDIDYYNGMEIITVREPYATGYFLSPIWV